ncbi:MAG: 3-hydroxyacyl-CoA dehydrogenase NAD-binding domain-containing protein [Planctomycetota bacterium]|jgi:3-hydroxyacyl-CoA dehydrogenase
MTIGNDGSTDGALVRYEVSDGVCVLRLNSPPLNTIALALLDELRACVRRANADDSARGIIITGDSHHFSAGADVNLFRDIAGDDDAVRISRVFQEAFQEVEDSAKPVAAAVAGKMMGSAIELASACHFRVSDSRATFRMPEVNLGINPGAGGTGRLPRLVGPGAALRMLLTAESMSAADALELGLVDAACEGDGLLARARELVLAGRPIVRTGERTDKIDDAEATAAAFGEAAKLIAAARPELIAPSEIARAVRVGLEESFAAGLLEEQSAFARCMATCATRNRIYVFFATRGTAKASDLGDAAPVEVRKAAVVGMGSMGTGIAHAFAIAGVPVAILDAAPGAVERAVAKIGKSVGKRVDAGKLAPERAEAMLALVTPAKAMEDLAGADLVVEAVVEDADVKRAVIAELERACADETVIATNTSTISLDELARGMRRPGRLVGMHFFNPAHRMPLVEVIRREGAGSVAVATALAAAKKLRKTPILVKNRVGFVVNRIFIPYFKEAFALLEEGAAAEVVDAAMVEFGFPMGPLALIDMAGLDILALTDDVMARAFPAHGELSRIARRLVELGRLGQKTGGGVYSYEKGDYTPRPSDATAGVVAEAMRQSGRTPRAVGRDEITDRLVLRMVAEAFAVMEEGLVERESDIDAAMVLGTGFPDFRGGVIRYARDAGLGFVLARLEELAGRFGERFAPCELLRTQAGDERS